MRYTKNVLQLQKADEGIAINLVVGMFIILFMALFMVGAISLRGMVTASDYLEDAITNACLAAVRVDLTEYGKTGQVYIRPDEELKGRFVDCLRENLNLNESMQGANEELFDSEVQVENFIVYNVFGEETESVCYERDGRSETLRKQTGRMQTPQNQMVEKTGVYGMISCFYRDVFGQKHYLRKGKLVDVVGKCE